MADLQRFKDAQDRAVDGFDSARRELATGEKRGHWIWYLFPQLTGLGRSPASVHYGLHGVAEALDYLRDPLLRARLCELTTTLLGQMSGPPSRSLVEVMGSQTDAVKTVSSLTLFADLSRRMSALEPHSDYSKLAAQADSVLALARYEGFPECTLTRRALAEHC
jgi:uncharacterized protein (DUF1810 family)